MYLHTTEIITTNPSNTDYLLILYTHSCSLHAVNTVETHKRTRRVNIGKFTGWLYRRCITRTLGRELMMVCFVRGDRHAQLVQFTKPQSVPTSRWRYRNKWVAFTLRNFFSVRARTGRCVRASIWILTHTYNHHSIYTHYHFAVTYGRDRN